MTEAQAADLITAVRAMAIGVWLLFVTVAWWATNPRGGWKSRPPAPPRRGRFEPAGTQ